MIRFRYFALLGFACLLVASVGGRIAQGKTPTSIKQSQGRSLASLAPTHAGQGEQMLYSVKSSSPRFLNETKSAGPVRIAGVCRDPYGVSYMSTDKGYVSCLDSQSATMNDYFAAQRQAGVGIFVGK